LILLNLSIATSWDGVEFKSHELRLLHVGIALTTILVTESLSFSIWVPLVMGLDMSMILVEGVIQVTIYPRKLRNVTEEEWHLLVAGGGLLILLSNWVQFLVQIRVYDFVTKVPVWLALMPIKFRVC